VRQEPVSTITYCPTVQVCKKTGNINIKPRRTNLKSMIKQECPPIFMTSYSEKSVFPVNADILIYEIRMIFIYFVYIEI